MPSTRATAKAEINVDKKPDRKRGGSIFKVSFGDEIGIVGTKAS